MGNFSVTNTHPLYLSTAVAWKTGPRTETVPAESAFYDWEKDPDPTKDAAKNLISYDKLSLSSDFKNFLLANLDSDYLVSSILNVGTAGEVDEVKLLLEGIRIVNPPDPDRELDILQQVKAFESCLSAGIDVKLSEALSICERELSLKYLLNKSPFLISFQKRLGLLCRLRECIKNERKEILKSKTRRFCTNTILQSTSFPQLKAILSLNQGAISLLKALPSCLPTLSAIGQEDVLIQPVIQICSSLRSIDSLELFSCWSPKCKAPLSKLDFNTAFTITAVSGDSSKESIVVGREWSCNNGGEWTATFKTPQNVSSIQISWISDETKRTDSSAECTAPFRLTILSALSNQSNDLRPVLNIKPDEEFKIQKSWIQTYPIGKENVHKLVLKLSNKLSASNKSKTAKICSFDIFCDKTIAWVDTLQLLQDLQFSLIPLVNFSALENPAFDSLITLIKGSGSLSLLLNFLICLATGKIDESKLRLSSLGTILDLLQTLQAENNAIRKTLNDSCGYEMKDMQNCQFDIKFGNSNGCTVSPAGDSVSCSTDCGYCFISCAKESAVSRALDSGIYEWTLTVVEPIEGSVYFGVASASSASSEKDYSPLNSKEIRAVCCLDGSIHSNGPNNTNIRCKIKAGDICRFIFEVKMRMVSLYINDDYQGIIFEQALKGMSPVVIFRNLAKPAEVKLLGVRHSEIFNRATGTRERWEQRDKYEIENLKQSSTHIFSLVLAEIGCLCQMKSAEMCINESGFRSKQCPLEFPFCVEVSALVLQQLHILINLESRDSESINNVKALVEILDLQLFCLTLSKLELLDVGLGPSDTSTVDGRSSVNCQELIVELKNTLKTLMKSDNLELELLAVRAFCRGLCLYSSSDHDKIELVLDIFNAEKTYTNSTAARDLLIDLTIGRFSSLDEVLNIIEICSSNKLEHRNRLYTFLEKMVEIATECTMSGIQTIGKDPLGKISFSAKLEKTICKFLSAFQQHAVFDVTTDHDNEIDDMDPSTDCSPLAACLLCLGKAILLHGSKIINVVYKMPSTSICFETLERIIRESVVGVLVQPFLHSLCIQGHSLKFLQSIMPCVIFFMEKLSEVCGQSPQCALAQHGINSTIQRYHPRASSTIGSGGWRQIRATFEDSDNSFSLSDGGLTYTSLHSTNTCAVVNIKFGVYQKAAWEFCLEHDSNSDECSVFGAARLPLRSRCYSSSPDLWMRRSYNGYMYNQGQSTGSTLDKIHPGDVIRIEFDGKAGTLSYSVNGSDLEVGFTDIAEDIYPACGSYRNGVIIKLLKVEVFETASLGEDRPLDRFKIVPNQNISWILDEAIMSPKDQTTLTAYVPHKNEKKRKKGTIPAAWLTARTNSACCAGINEWSFEFLEWFDAPFSLGAVFGVDPPSTIRLASQIVTKKEYVSSYAWYSDGSLWCDGVKLAENYGIVHFPLPKFSSVRMLVNRIEHTVSYFVNGESLGIAFGPKDSGAAAVVLNFPPSCTDAISNSSDERVLYPAASIYSTSATLAYTTPPAIKIRTSGFNGSTTVPILLSLQKASAAVLGRLSALLLLGPSVNKTESVLIPWLQSPLLIGGLEEAELTNMDTFNSMDWQSSLDTTLRHFGIISPNDIDQHEENVPPAVLSDKNLDAGFILLKKLANLEYADTECVQLFEWLEAIDPESSSLRKVFEKSGIFSFPVCEFPVTACLLKHGGLLSEAVSALKALNSVTTRPTPSEEMIILWQRVKQLRTYLRQQRQNMKVSEYSFASNTSASLNETEQSPAEDSLLVVTVDSAARALMNHAVSADTTTEDIFGKYFCGTSEKCTILWIEQPEGIRSVYNAQYACTVKSLGMDEENKQIYIHFAIKCDLSLGSLQSPSFSTLKVDSITFTDPDKFLLTDTDIEKSGYLRFEITSPIDWNTGPNMCIEFAFGQTGYSYVKLILKGKSIDVNAIVEAKDPPLRKFDELCSIISSKAAFLLKISPAVNAADFNRRTSKTSLIGLTKKYSGNIPSSGNKADLSRWSSQERWKRVIEFLHYRSKQPKTTESEHSTESTQSLADPESDSNSVQQSTSFPTEKRNVHNIVSFNRTPVQNDDDLSHSQAAMQACTVFITTEAVKFDANILNGILRRRMYRANLRMYVLHALNHMCTISAIVNDPFCLFELLLCTRMAIALYASKNDGGKEIVKNRNHYLTNLEGCTTLTMSAVQSSFVGLYSTVAGIFSMYTTSWEALSISATFGVQEPLTDSIFEIKPQFAHILLIPMHLIIELWTLNFSIRDHKWILASGFLQSLCKLMSCTSREKAVQTYITAAEKLGNFYDKCRSNFTSKFKWNVWSQDYVLSGLLKGTLSCRSLLLHIFMAPENRISKQDRIDLGIDGNVLQVIEKVKYAPEASYLYAKILSKVNKILEMEAKEKELKEVAKVEEDAKFVEEIASRLCICGLFDPANKHELIRLSEYNTTAILDSDESGIAACVYSTISYSLATLNVSGNYFEVEIITLGRGDIGVGLADRNTFDTANSMPGWVVHSYGYHGDDGRKFGANSTPGDWSLFTVGDIIGCGFDMTRRAIFYTRNGELLGDGFTDVDDPLLWPIVGFSNRNEGVIKVSINFGVKPFVYEGPEVIVNVAALEERLRVSVEAEAAVFTPTVRNDAIIELSTEDNGKDSKCSSPIIKESEYVQGLNSLIEQLDAAAAFVFETDRLSHQSALILRFLLEISCQTDGDAEEVVEREQKTSSTSQSTVFVKPILTKAISVFGTPKFINLADSAVVQETLLTSFLQEIQLSLDYLSQPMDGMRSLASMNYLQTAPASFHVPTGFSDEHAVLDSADLEGMTFFHLQTLAIALSISKSIREELSTEQTLHLLFSILHGGSIRNRSLSCNLLIKLLPLVGPDVAESAIIEAWLKCNFAYEAKLVPPLYRQRQHRMPDGVVQALFLIIAKELTADCCDSEHWQHVQHRWYSPESNNYPDGFGSITLEFVDQKLHLLRTLFEAPLWSELVACCITEAFRNAMLVLERANSDHGNFIPTEIDKEILQLACAAGLSLCGIGTLYPGNTILTLSKTACKIVNCVYDDQKVYVVPVGRLSSFDSSKYLEYIDMSTISSVGTSLQVDLSNQSQPMLPNLFSIVQKLLQWISKSGPSFSNRKLTLYERTQLRLTSISALLVTSLLSNQPDVITDFIQDAKIAQQILAIALMPVQLKFLAKKEFMNDLWIYFQARNLETVPSVSPAQNTAVVDEKSSTFQIEVDAPSTDSTSTLPSPSVSSIINISPSVRKDIQESASVLSEELNIPLPICMMHFEYFALSIDETRSSLRKLNLVENYEADYSMDFTAKEVEKAPPVEGDQNVLKNLDSANFNPENCFPSEGPGHLYLEPLPDSSSDVSQKSNSIVLVESSEEGYVTSFSKPIVLGSRVEHDSSDLLVSKFDRSQGSVFTALAKSSSYRAVKKRYGLECSELFSTMVLIDISATILRFRSVASRLLSDGNLSLEQDTADIKGWSKLLKLIVTSSSSLDIKKQLDLNCSALLSRPSSIAYHSNIDESAVIDVLIDDIKGNLSSLASPDSLSKAWQYYGSENIEDDSNEPLVFSSPHPFFAPYTAIRKINIPKTWRTISVAFSTHCSTPSEDAVLSFYTSETNLQQGVPQNEFYGPADESGVSKFKNFTLYNIQELIFKFCAKPKSDKMKSRWLPLLGNPPIVCKEFELSVAEENDSGFPVGLGDDDSLFNLFSDLSLAVPIHKASTVIFDCDPFSSDVWYFEVVVKGNFESHEETDGLINQRIGVIDSALCTSSIEQASSSSGVILGSTEGSIGLSPQGYLYRDGSIVFRDSNLSEWKAEDIIGCLFKIDNSEGLSVWFSKNGTWSTKFHPVGFAKTLKPAVTLTQLSKFTPNDGSRTFLNGPSTEIMEEVRTVNAIFDRPLTTTIKKMAWGYHFAVQRVSQPLVEACNEFELVWSSQVKAEDVSEKFWIWRAKSTSAFKPCGDIITTVGIPPRRTLLFDKIQCQSPAKFNCVFSCQKAGIAVWRPVPPFGYVALGDVATPCTSSSPSAPSLGSLHCIPLWAVEKCEIKGKVSVMKKVGEAKTPITASFWSLDSGLGHFLACPNEQRRGSGQSVDVIGEGWALKFDVLSIIEGEWFTENDVICRPSLSWSCHMTQFLLEYPVSRMKVLQDDLFQTMIKFMKSSVTPAPLNLIPTLIHMIRASLAEHVDINLSDLSGLCKAILTHASQIAQEKKPVFSKALMRLVDFVVEIQMYFITKSTSKDPQPALTGVEPLEIENLESIDAFDEAKDLEGSKLDLMVAQSDSFAPKLDLTSTDFFGKDWWKRSDLSTRTIREHRVIRKENVENLFARESAILKMRQTLKFFNAIGLFSPPTSIVKSADTQLIDRPYPKFMTSKLWFDYASFCFFLESNHPYHIAKLEKRKIHFPGAKKLIVVFDRRTFLRKADKLILSGEGHNCIITRSSSLETAHTFKGDALEISVESSAEGDPIEENDCWGWAFLVHGNGDLFTDASCTIDLSEINSVSEIASNDISKGEGSDKKCFSAEAHSQLPTSMHVAPDALSESESGADSTDGESNLPIKTKDMELFMEFADDNNFPEDSEVQSPKDLLSQIRSFKKRPHTKRGKRAAPLVEDAVMEKVSPVDEKKNPPPLSAAEVILNIVSSSGALVSSGMLQVPHASQLEMKLERQFSSEMTNFEVILSITSPDDKGDVGPTATRKNINISTTTSCLPENEVFYSSRIYYEIRAMKKKTLETRLAALNSVRSQQDAPEDPLNVAFAKIDKCFCSPPCSEPLSTCLRGWRCAHCTHENQPSAMRCIECDTDHLILVKEAAASSGGRKKTLEEGYKVEGNYKGKGKWVAGRIQKVRLDGSYDIAYNDGEQEMRVPEDLVRAIDSADSRPKAVVISEGMKVTDVPEDATPKDEQVSAESKVIVIDGGNADEAKSLKPSGERNALVIKVSGTLSSVGRYETRLEAAILSGGAILTPLQTYDSIFRWSKEADKALLEYLNSKKLKLETSLSQINTFAIPEKFLTYEGNILSSRSMLDIQIRVLAIEAFNKSLEYFIPFVDLTNEDPMSMGAMIRRSNQYLLMKVKGPLLEKALTASSVPASGDIPASIVLDNFKAIGSKERGEKDIFSSHNCFVQAFKQLSKKDPAVFRHIISGDRVLQITFAGEGGIDAGGVFREGASRIIEDLFSPDFNLLLLSKNGQHNVHNNLDKFVPNPANLPPFCKNSVETALEMFDFVGKLMGMSLRAKLYLPFEFPHLIWKKIVGEEVLQDDLFAVDALSCKLIDEIRNCDSDPKDPVTDEETFQARFTDKMPFVFSGSDGVERELGSFGGRKRMVTFANRIEYCDAVVAARLSEFDAAVIAIRKGLGEVVPLRMLMLFSALQLEELVCGSPTFDIDLWKSNTETSGLSASTVTLFWKVMASLPQKDQAGFVRFAWGRSRLPPAKEFHVKMRLTSGGRATLPVSHTCFFSVELPEYKTEEEMRHGILTAIHFGVGGILMG